jgi:hypothetical protein
MTEAEIAQLDRLLLQLSMEIGHRFCIIPRAFHDGVQLGIYDEYGNPGRQVTAPTLKEAIEKIKA